MMAPSVLPFRRPAAAPVLLTMTEMDRWEVMAWFFQRGAAWQAKLIPAGGAAAGLAICPPRAQKAADDSRENALPWLLWRVHDGVALLNDRCEALGIFLTVYAALEHVHQTEVWHALVDIERVQ